MLRDTSTKTQTSVGMTSGHGGGSLTARSEGGMRFPMRSDDITAQCALIVKSNKENTFLQKDASSEHTSKSDIESPLFEDDEENEFEKWKKRIERINENKGEKNVKKREK